MKSMTRGFINCTVKQDDKNVLCGKRPTSQALFSYTTLYYYTPQAIGSNLPSNRHTPIKKNRNIPQATDSTLPDNRHTPIENIPMHSTGYRQQSPKLSVVCGLYARWGKLLEKRLLCDLPFYTILHRSIRFVILVSMHFSSCSRNAGKVASELRASSCKECECGAAECYPSQTSRVSSSKPNK